MRDHVGWSQRDAPVPEEEEFVDWLRQREEVLYISTHPERWPATMAGRIQAATQDRVINLVKRMIEFSRWLS